VEFASGQQQRAAREGSRDPQRGFQASGCRGIIANHSSVDVALVNGIFNLNPSRKQIFCELARVLRPGGKAYAAELILAGPLPPNVTQTDADWFA